MKRKLAFLLVLVISLALPLPAFADGIIVPDPPICDPMPCPPMPIPMEQLVIRYHHVTVTIEDQVAITHVDQVFFNPNEWQIEGTYIFPIPLDAAVTGFTLWVDGQPVEGQVLDATEARQVYEEIVATMRDPALLEYAGRGAVQARIFPIPPGGERRVELEYTQALAAENGLVKYVYPLNTEKYSAWPIESVSVSIDIKDNSPIRAAYSPSHEVAVSRESDYHVKVGYEAYQVTPNIDFALYYSLGETEAFHVLSYRDPADPVDADGFFLLLLAPSINTTMQIIPKDVILVLDRSGSMDGEKFQQALEALRYILQHLNPEDRFNIITFSTGIQSYATGLRPASEAAEARPWVDSLYAEGSTDINRALLEAAAITDHQRPTYLIFLTDGLPTEGVTDSQMILQNFAATAPDNLRLFSFGVGYDVDTILLDTLALEHHGLNTYVLPGEPLDEILSAFYSRISTPVLTDLGLDFGELSVYDIYPAPLPDLFMGSQIIVVGRYRQGGETDVTLTGEFNGELQTLEFPQQYFSRESSNASIESAIPRLWATRKIGHLLNLVRLNGPEQETIDQIVYLSIRYGIVTPYTSYLITEEMPLGAAEQERIAGEQFEYMESQPAAPSSGQDAVEKAADLGGLGGASNAEGVPEDAADVVRIVGARTFVQSEGVWIDTTFDPDTMTTVQVPFLSVDYFALVESIPDLAAAFALGEHVIALANGIAYEVVASDETTPPVDIPPTAIPTAP
ncbi:MAG: VWA domain-containing protein, partial [Anaerolineales bacterium]|nr:VWA domain-containing protein [Anaerolineales bacterium]